MSSGPAYCEASVTPSREGGPVQHIPVHQQHTATGLDATALFGTVLYAPELNATDCTKRGYTHLNQSWETTLFGTNTTCRNVTPRLDRPNRNVISQNATQQDRPRTSTPERYCTVPPRPDSSSRNRTTSSNTAPTRHDLPPRHDTRPYESDLTYLNRTAPRDTDFKILTQQNTSPRGNTSTTLHRPHTPVLHQLDTSLVGTDHTSRDDSRRDQAKLHRPDDTDRYHPYTHLCATDHTARITSCLASALRHRPIGTHLHAAGPNTTTPTRLCVTDTLPHSSLLTIRHATPRPRHWATLRDTDLTVQHDARRSATALTARLRHDTNLHVHQTRRNRPYQTARHGPLLLMTVRDRLHKDIDNATGMVIFLVGARDYVSTTSRLDK